MESWTTHTAADGRTFYYERESNTSTYERPTALDSPAPARLRPTLQSCLDSSSAVASLYNAIIRYCGASALPVVRDRPARDPLCEGGRGGAYCCASNRIYLCAETPWVGCRELAYELSHALNTCRGAVRCSHDGIQVEDRDCGYMSPPDVACSELRAAHWTGRCASRADGPARQRCLEWHARWATEACYPDDAHLDAHVRWARHRCKPVGPDEHLTATRPPPGPRPPGPHEANQCNAARSNPGTWPDAYVEQAERWL